MIIFLYGLLLSLLTIYSFALVDPNITFIQHPLWVAFREQIITFGYYHRDTSVIVYIAIVALLFVFQYYFVKNSQKISITKILYLISTILLLSYPFLSHDFFNYLFDAKIVTFYHQNPYIHRALDYPTDQWIRFMHWTHRTYPYGPTWLLISIVPSFLSFGKFILDFIFFKMLFTIFYIIATLSLAKLNKKWAMFFATSPLVIIEGLVSSHNDLVAVAIGIFGINLLLSKKRIPALMAFLISGGIKYITLPFLFLLGSKNKYAPLISFVLTGLLIGYISYAGELQPWYFLAFFAFLPWYSTLLERSSILMFGLLASYYPYIRFGPWNRPEEVIMKHQIMIFFAIINILYFLIFSKKTAKST